MAPASKSSVSRRKSNGATGALTIVLKVSPDRLKDLLDPQPTKEETPAKDSPEDKAALPTEESKPESAAASPAPSNTQPTTGAVNGENASDSTPATPAATANGTPAPGTMAPPVDGSKKKGTKRSAGAANGLGPDGLPKVRGKPGPKKKARLEDGTIDPNSTGRGGAGAHKLGPKANQGAINAGLRALDRSGKPCRKWSKGGFTMKSFTGVVWEIPRWTAPPHIVIQPSDDSNAASADSSSKENKEVNDEPKSDANSAMPNSNANSAAGVEANSGPGSAINPSSPAPMAIPAA
ncbi:hypothetical protein VD0002_g3253 [Verticillium dahliae]|nr:hypothetical protein VD0002_g3253 [Verticillium dahliae]